MASLTKTDIKVLIDSVTSTGFTFGKVYGSTAENKKREFNSIVKLVKLGLVVGEVTYEHQNGYQSQVFGRLWVSGFSWNDFSGKLTESGLFLAMAILANI